MWRGRPVPLCRARHSGRVPAAGVPHRGRECTLPRDVRMLAPNLGGVISSVRYGAGMTQTTETTTENSEDYLQRIGSIIRDARQHSGLTQAQLAAKLGSSQSAVNRIEKGQQNLTLETLSKIGTALDSQLVGLGTSGPSHLRVHGRTTLSGAIDVKSSKNAGVALLCASLLNTGTTVLRKVARIEEVNRQIGRASCRERV